ncbi:MAG: autotransporter outer membrane beta-barrel domain-containing protein [Planctomycetes bacterium]|nr:autotransporter outer membrane beta-barrel domain-containing protein [Planctomycetota bacterium]
MNSGVVNGAITADTAASAAPNVTTSFTQNGGTMSGDSSVRMAGKENLFHLTNNAIFQGKANISGDGGHIVIVNVNDGITVTGKIDLSNTTGGANKMFLANGEIVGSANGFIHGAGAGSTEFEIGMSNTGTISDYVNVKQLYGGVGSATFNVRAGQAYNIWAGVSGWEAAGTGHNLTLSADVHLGNTANFRNGKASYNYTSGEDYDYIVYSVLGNEIVNIGGTGDHARVVIGAIDYAANNNSYASIDLNTGVFAQYYNGHQAQISAGTVNVFANSKLTIHENADVMGANAALNDHFRNVVDNMVIQGTPGQYDNNTAGASKAVVTIDRTTLQGTVAYDPATAGSGSKIIVGMNGILQGFGEFTASSASHDPLRANVIGTVDIKTGGMLRPYDGEIFKFQGTVGTQFIDGPAEGETQAEYFARRDAWLAANLSNQAFENNTNQLKGLIFQVDGKTTFDMASHYSTRLWAQQDGNKTLDIMSDGEDFMNDGTTLVAKGDTATVTRYHSDGLSSSEFNFDDILTNNTSTDWVARQANKVQYEPVFGARNELRSKMDFELYKGTGTDERTYYFQVAYSDGGTPIDALVGYDDANHLFNRDIVFSDMLGQWSFLKQDGDSGVVLRFRMLAPHPVFGGITSIMPDRNAREAARKIDEMRYPFTTAYNTEIGTYIGFDPSHANGYGAGNASGYNIDGYSGNMDGYYSSQPQFTNYRPEWIADFENYLRGLQLSVPDGETLHEIIRLVHPEPYATMTAVNLNVMDMFTANRMRNGMSALYAVEERDEKVNYGPAHDGNRDVQFVANPFRIWTSAFGNNARHDRSGQEYGYKDDVYGTSLGFIKEVGDFYLGATVGYARGDNEWKELNAEAKTDNYLTELHLGWRFGMAFVEAYGNYGHMRHTMNREILAGEPLNPDIGDPGIDGWHNGVYRARVKGKYHDQVYGGGLRLGYQKTLGESWLILPSIGINYLSSRNADFVETGRDDAFGRLVFGKDQIKKSLYRIPVTVRVNKVFPLGSFLLTPEARVGYTMTLGNRHGTATSKFIGNPIDNRYFRAYGADPGQHAMNAGATLELSRAGRFYFAGNYDFYLTKASRVHSYSIQAGLNF